MFKIVYNITRIQGGQRQFGKQGKIGDWEGYRLGGGTGNMSWSCASPQSWGRQEI